MNIEEKEAYTLITSDETSFDVFFDAFTEASKKYAKGHLVTVLSENILVNKENILSFVTTATEHRKNKTSFVLVYDAEDIDDFPETLNIVPTLLEANDVLEMEAIERDLGF